MPDQLDQAAQLKGNDMDDTEEIKRLKNNPSLDPLVKALEVCERVIFPRYVEQDGEAKERRTGYRHMARSAAVLGSAAVIIAIVQFAGWFPTEGAKTLLPIFELLAAVGAVSVALFGLSRGSQKPWLLARYKAERLRLLKFDFLTRPETWKGGGLAAGVEDALTEESKTIDHSGFTALEQWLSQGMVPDVRLPAAMPDEVCRALQQYYLRQRVQGQLDYFSDAAETNEVKHRGTWMAAPSLFFASVAFVLAHICVEFTVWLKAWHPAPESDWWENLTHAVGEAEHAPGIAFSHALMAIAAILPVIGAGVRVYRGAFEFGRNAQRFQAVHHALYEVSQRLRTAQEPAAIFRDIGFCELVVEGDSRAWIRLMAEVEFFG